MSRPPPYYNVHIIIYRTGKISDEEKKHSITFFPPKGLKHLYT